MKNISGFILCNANIVTVSVNGYKLMLILLVCTYKPYYLVLSGRFTVWQPNADVDLPLNSKISIYS